MPNLLFTWHVIKMNDSDRLAHAHELPIGPRGSKVVQGCRTTRDEVVMMSDFYRTLKVDANASAQQIQSAYLYWAQELQEDQPPADLTRIEQLQRAYSVLTAANRRLQSRPFAEPLCPVALETGRAPQVNPAVRFSLRESPGECRPSFDELFERFWSNFAQVTRPKAERIESLTVEIPLSPEEAARGGWAQVLIPARARCPSCLGHGAVGPYECWRCRGQGAITADYPLDVEYPPTLRGSYSAQFSLDQFGICNFFLTVFFRVTDELPA